MSDVWVGMGDRGLGTGDEGLYAGDEVCADDRLCVDEGLYADGAGRRRGDGGDRTHAGTPVQALAPALSFQGLSFSYPDSPVPVLEDVCLSVEPGAFALLVGDTGSGKSTLLSLVKPQIAPAGRQAGSVRVFGRPAGDLSDEESARTVGFVFQDPDNQIVCDSVWHEMAFGMESLGVPQAEMRRRVAEAGYFFGMGEWFRSPTDALSGGRKQLLALASTLVMQPRLLLLDEPTAQLDPIATKNFLHALFRVNRELGCTVVVATHAPESMADYATCAFELRDGRVREVALEELRRRASMRGPEDDVTAAAHAGRMRARVASGRLAVEAHGAWFRYERDGDWVLRGADLTVRAGELHALVGGNGCGKSTLLALMAGLHRPQRGSLRVDVRERALLPQDPKALFAEECVFDELMEWSGVGAYGQREVEGMLSMLGLVDRAAAHPYDLSGGQRQLLALGKVLLVRPRLLLLDEPTKGLDRAARRRVAEVLEEERVRGTTIVMATHDLGLVSSRADSVSLLFDGEVACTEPADAFFRNNIFYRL